MMSQATEHPPTHGYGVLIAFMILLGVELYLHNDDFLHRYRSVFAVGRAADKIDYVVKAQPRVIFMGNSRVDNGISPTAISSALKLRDNQIFNLGIPGQNTRVLAGVARELGQRKAFSSPSRKYVMIGLDSTLFSLDDELNYFVFFADRWQMAVNGEYAKLLSSIFRLWGYSHNLKGLREPARMLDFISATLTDRDPWGGSVQTNLGYRAKQERLTPAQRDSIPAHYVPPVLHGLSQQYFLGALKHLLKQGVHVGVFFTPKYGRRNAFEIADNPNRSYMKLLADIQALDVAVFHVPEMNTYDGDLYSDPGHLNEDGARRYSARLAESMFEQWPEIGTAQ